MIAWSETQVNIEEAMKRILLLSGLGLFLAGGAWAQSDSTNASSTPSPATPPPAVQPGSPLSPDEDQEVNKAHSAALFADPSLAAEEKVLWGKFKAARDSGQRPGPEVMAELRDYNAKLEAAMIKADPKVEPLLAKLEAAHPH